jgi:hypothetical protein
MKNSSKARDLSEITAEIAKTSEQLSWTDDLEDDPRFRPTNLIVRELCARKLKELGEELVAQAQGELSLAKALIAATKN